MAFCAGEQLFPHLEDAPTPLNFVVSDEEPAIIELVLLVGNMLLSHCYQDALFGFQKFGTEGSMWALRIDPA